VVLLDSARPGWSHGTSDRVNRRTGRRSRSGA
jgi:hypothetical protein